MYLIGMIVVHGTWPLNDLAWVGFACIRLSGRPFWAWRPVKSRSVWEGLSCNLVLPGLCLGGMWHPESQWPIIIGYFVSILGYVRV